MTLPLGTAQHRPVELRLIILCALMAMVPLLWPTIPPLTDLPGHIGRYAVQLDGGRTAHLAAWYTFEWAIIGNLGVDLLVQLFAPFFGLERAVKLIIIAIPALQVAGFLLVARQVHGRIPPQAWFALPLAYSYPFQFGFVNFALSMALAWIGFALWLRLSNRASLRAWLFVPLSCLLWLCHMYGWAVLCVLVVANEVIRHGGLGLKAMLPSLRSCLPLLPPLGLMAYVMLNGTGSGETERWFDLAAKASWLASILRDRWMPFDIASAAILFSLISWMAVSPRFKIAPPLAVACGVLALLFLLMPRTLLGSTFADMRLAPHLVALAIIAFRIDGGWSKEQTQALMICAVAFFAVRMIGNGISFFQYDRDWTRQAKALSHIPVGSRLVSFIGKPCAKPWHVHRLDHFPSLALERRMAFANDQWDLAGGQLLRVKYAAAGKFASNPSQFAVEPRCARENRTAFSAALKSFPRDAFDLVWIIDAPQDGSASFAGLTPVWRDGRNMVLRVDRASKGQ